MLWNLVGVGQSASFNGDGRRDVLARSFETGDLFVYPHQGRLDGLNTYGAPMKIGTGFHCGYFRWIGAGDFTGDGRADVYVTTADAKCFLYPNPAGLNDLDTLGERIHIGGKRPEVMYDSLALADLDGDGRVDCFGRQVGTGNVDSILNTGISGLDTWAAPEPMLTMDKTSWPIGMADVTGNGELDLIVRRDTGELALHDFFAGGKDADGRPKGAGEWYTISRGWDGVRAIDITDIDGDGKPDLLALRVDGTLVAHVHQGVFDPERPLSTFREPVAVAVGWNDFDYIS
ncbi:FG-GAP repeat domain-containing protein [Streptomyces malaysiensis]|uniref:FG-GAP repeat domain-containing protein n=1 Tax=Streptomyces malaysiensis TaxID=92644 RepID=UPI003331784B